MNLGASYLGGKRWRFRVWAPAARSVEVRLVAPRERLLSMERQEDGYHVAEADGVEPGALYFYRLDSGKERPDPASRFQPQGVHGPSAVVDPQTYQWSDSAWHGLALEDYVLYELHVGTFTPDGTFEAIIPRLEGLKDLGITAIELMPVAQFPGSRNWGYDGVFPFAVQASYGGPEGLKKLVDACHRLSLAVVLDLVYNHLGPEGNHLADFGPYFTDRYRTPWGRAMNFDGAQSDPVRHFFIENALYWLSEYHIDTFRLDAIHGICDFSAQPFLAELAEAVHRRAEELDRKVYLIPESDLNDVRAVQSPEQGGYGLDALWNDDFHHALHALLTSERDGYYQDFGRLEQLAKAVREGFVLSGQYSSYRQRRHGNSSAGLPAHQFVVFAQNHDQVGNRMRGERLTKLVSFEALKLAAGVVLLSPFLPLLFMGEEYGEQAPFHYFVSHSDPELIDAVRRGRKADFASFHWQGEPPDAQDEATFLESMLRYELSQEGTHKTLREFHKELLRLRNSLLALAGLSKEQLEVCVVEEANTLCLRRWQEGHQAFAAFHFGKELAAAALPVSSGRWKKTLDSSAKRWGGNGNRLPENLVSQGTVSLELSPTSLVLYTSAESAGS